MPLVPAIPQNMTVQQGNGQVLVSWDLVAGATLYRVQRSLDNVTFSLIASPATNQYIDASVTQGTTYYYKVAAHNTSGDSAYTLSQSVVPAQPGLLSLGQIREMAQQRADRVNSNFVTTPEWNTYINQSYTELYDLLVTSFEDYKVAEPVLFQVTGPSQYPLPDGITQFVTQTGTPITPPPFYKLLGVDCGIATNTNAWVTLQKFNFISRNRYVYPNVTSTYYGVFNLRYRVLDNTIMFIPTPSQGQWIRLWYIPRMATLLKDNDLADGINGWTEYVIIDAAIKALQKEESDVSVLMAQKQAMIDRIQAAASNRDAGAPDTISETRRGMWGIYGAPGGDGNFGGF